MVMVTDRSCNNKLVTTELVVQCRKSQVTYEVTGMKNLQKRIKVRSKNKVRFARAEQLWPIHTKLSLSSVYQLITPYCSLSLESRPSSLHVLTYFRFWNTPLLQTDHRPK